MSYAGAVEYLYGLQRHGIKLGLENTKSLLSRLGDPQKSFKSIHVAGTNGKGSTSAMAASLLSGAGAPSHGPPGHGYRTGLFTSPHLESFTERIRVDGLEITETEVIALTEEIRSAAALLTPTFFEFTTVMGFLYFQRKGVEWAVVETGMGGRLDATNVLEPEVTIITPVSLDHREFLGETLEEIAGEKAGIIKPKTPVVCARQRPEAMRIIEGRAEAESSGLYIAGRDFRANNIKGNRFGVTFDYASLDGLLLEGISVPLAGAYQAENAALAIKAFSLVSEGENIKKSMEKGSMTPLRLPWFPPKGRLEFIAPDILIDGAHNPAAAEALAEAIRKIKEDFPAGSAELIFGIMGDKDIEGILRPLLPLFDEVIFTAPDYGRAAPPEALSECARRLGFASKTSPTVAEAIGMARGRNHSLILITGSFYTIGEARALIKGPNKVKSPLKGLR